MPLSDTHKWYGITLLLHKGFFHMSRPGFSICACPDVQLIKNRIDALLGAHPAPEGAWERHVYWGDEGLPPAFWENLTLQGLFASPKALVVRNAQELAVDEWKKLSLALGSSNPQAWPFLCLEVAFDKNGPKVAKAVTNLKCWAFAEKQDWIWKSAGLSPRDIREFVAGWASRNGIAIAPPVLQALATNLPGDATAATRELEKLALAAGDAATITPDLAAEIAHESEMDIFAFINALQQGNAPARVWSRVMQGHTNSSEGIFKFLAMLLREARILWQLLSGENVFLPGNVKQNKERLAAALGRARIARIWDLALEAEKGIKSGERSPEQAMEMIVAGLIALFGPRNMPQKAQSSPYSRP